MKCFNLSGYVRFPDGFKKDMPYNDTFKRKLNLFKFNFSFDFDIYENDTRKSLYLDLFCGAQIPLCFIDYYHIFSIDHPHVVIFGAVFDIVFRKNQSFHITYESEIPESNSPTGVSLTKIPFQTTLTITPKEDVFKWYEKLDKDTIRYLLDHDITLEKQELLQYYRT